MIIEHLSVRQFGPFHDAEIDLAPGMTVFHGPNEAGKSTLHAALYAGLCGLRRGRGPRSIEEREFEERHKPWAGSRWRVGAVVRLADGRRITLEHDLDSRTCTAVDELGRGVAGEIVNDGAPDASVWLGLTRTSFLTTACVRQAQLALAASHAVAIQTELQRAAATAQQDATAAAAIHCLERYRSEFVGLDRANSTRPLRRAIDAERRADEALGEARVEQRCVLDLLATAEACDEDAAAASRRVAALEAAVVEARASSVGERLRRIEEIVSKYPVAPAPIEDDEREQAVADALAVWMQAPQPPPLTGRPSEEIEDELARLPEEPSGPAVVAEALRSAHARLELAEGSAADHVSRRPPEPRADPAPDIDDSTIREFVAALEAVAPELDPSLVVRQDQARQQVDAVRTTPRALWLTGGGAAIAGAVGVVVAPLLGVALIVLAIGVLVGAALHRANAGTRQAAALTELRDAEEALGAARFALDRWETQRRTAEARCAELGLSSKPAELAATLSARAAAAVETERLASWEGENAERARRVSDAARELTRLLDEAGAAPDDDPKARFHAHSDACAARAVVLEDARRRPELIAQLDARRAAERDVSARAEALARLEAAAVSVSVQNDDPALLAESLGAWLRERRTAREARHGEVQEWAALEGLLDGRSVDEFKVDAAELRHEADRLAAGCPAEEVTRLAAEPGLAQMLEAAREAYTEAVGAAGIARGDARTTGEKAPDVAEAEEAAERAAAELARVRLLDQTLALALEFLNQAQDRVHRDLAPILASSVAAALPRVTQGRYVGVRVDPADLSVALEDTGGEWRAVNTVSHGTREQVYLLLRVALAEHLVVAGEHAPLIFDEVTAHADSQRRSAVLDLLHSLSRDRQIILFTHEDDVRDWAAASLVAPADRLELVGA